MSTPQTTAVQPLFYREVVPVSAGEHRDLSLDPSAGFAFAGHTNSVYLMAGEFVAAAREYPIVFAGVASERVVPVALLGLRPQQNLFLEADGRWDAEYVPAYVRRYPFVLAQVPAADGGERFSVCIDAAWPGLNREGRGERLLADDGSAGPLMNRTMEFLQQFQVQWQLTEAFCTRIVELGLLEPVSARVRTAAGEEFSLSGFSCVKREALKALPADTLKELAASDYLQAVYLHLWSLDNQQRLLGRLERAQRS
jgi:hypothetical protein